MNSLLLSLLIFSVVISQETEETFPCTGTQLMLEVTNPSNKDFLVYTLTPVGSTEPVHTFNSATDNHVYTFCPTSQYYTLALSTSNGDAYWPQGVYVNATLNWSLTEYEHLGRYSYNTLYMENPTSFVLNTQYTVSYNSEWKYSYEETSSGFIYTEDYLDWSTSKHGEFPAATSRVQVFKKAFSLEESSIVDLSGFVLFIRYKYACIVYVNENEVFRHGVEGNLPNIQYTRETPYEDVIYRQITRPFYDHNSLTGRSNYFLTGDNTISIVIVTDGLETVPEFDCVVRFIHKNEATSRMIDYQYFYTDVTTVKGENAAFDLYPNSYIESDNCVDSSVAIKFDNERREWISGIKITSGDSDFFGLPTGFKVMARNFDNEEWTLLKTAEKLNFVWYLRTVHFKIINDQSFNQYMITGITNSRQCADGKKWRIAEVDFTIDYYNNIPDLSYPEIRFTAAANVVKQEIYPLYNGYSDFTVDPDLPNNVVLDPLTGSISSTARSDYEGNHKITAYKWDGEYTEVTVKVVVAPCGENSEIVTIVANYARTGQWLWPADVKNVLEVYSGKGESATLAHYLEYSASNARTVDFCLPYGIYTAKFYSKGPEGYSAQGEHYNIRTDNRKFTHFIGSVGKGYDSYTFSTYLPLKSTTVYDVYKSTEAVPENWNAVSYTPENWDAMSNFGTAETTTVYIRKTFDIPSLTDYHVLNIQVTYIGGIVCYFNGHKVARFNLPAEYDSTTLAIEPKTAAVTSSFAIILGDYDATLTGNVIAFEIHSGSADSHTVTFEASSAYGVNDCSLLTYSTPGVIRSNYQSSDNTNPFFDWNFNAYAENTSDNAFALWSVDNLEGARFNALGVKQYYTLGDKIYTATQCNVGLEGYDDVNRKYTTIGHFHEEDFSVSELRTFILANTASETDFKLVQNKACATNSLRISEVFYEYCVAPSCAADGEYPAALNGYKSYASCSIGFTGYKYRVCNNGILNEEVVEECTYSNDITYNGDNFIPIRVGEIISYTPATLLPFESISAIGLPEGVVMNEVDGTFSGSISEPVTTEVEVSVTYVCAGHTRTIKVYFLTIEEDVFAITKDAVVTLGGETVPADGEGCTLYDFYHLDYNTEYAIVGEHRVNVIPPYGLKWKYTLPEDMSYGQPDGNGGMTTANLQITKDTLFTHYQFFPGVCPSGTEFVFTYENEEELNAKFFCVPTGSEQYISTNIVTEVKSMTSESITPADFLVFDKYNVQGTTQANGEADAVISDNKNEGVCGMGYYYSWPSAEYVSKMMMDIQLTSSSSNVIILRPSLTFANGKKKSLIDPTKKEFLTVLKTLAADETITNYSAEAALELMEIAYYLKNGQPIVLSRTHLFNLLAEFCTDSCTGYENIVSILQNNGVCVEGEDLETCTPIKMEGFLRPSTADKTTKWIKDQIDAGRPVFTLLSLDPAQVQHHTYFNPNPINKAATGIMNFGGVITGYNAEMEGVEYWEVMVRRHGDLNNMIKVKMDITGKNFGRISNYAFTLNLEEE